MTILLDTDNKKVLSISSGGFVGVENGILQYQGNPHKVVEYTRELPETEEGQSLIYENGELKAV